MVKTGNTAAFEVTHKQTEVVSSFISWKYHATVIYPEHLKKIEIK